MIIINVLCLPKEQTEEEYHGLHKALVTAVIGMSRELEIEGMEDIKILLSRECELGSNVTIEAMLFSPPKQKLLEVHGLLAEKVGQNVRVCYPETEIVCHADVFVNITNGKFGCWISSR